MPQPTKGPRFGGSPAHQRIILANLASQLFEHGRITTTETKAKRVRRRFIGAHAPRHPLPCGCRSTTSKGIDGQVRGRLSGAEKHARALRARRIGFISLTEA